MSLAPYRRVLARPGVRSLLLIAVLARVPLTAAPVVLVLHVVLDLHLGFTRAGVLGAVFAVGAAVGSPLLGRGVDRLGLRPVLVVTTAVEGAFWLGASRLGFTGLLVSGAVAGLLAIPIFSLSRQALSALVPPQERQAAFSLDSMGVELSYAAGPAAGISLFTATSATTTLVTLGALVLAAGCALVALDPPVRADDHRVADEPAARSADHDLAAPTAGARPLVTRAVAAVLVVTLASTLVVAGTDTALTGVMTSWHAVHQLSLVFVVWCLASLAGGFVMGASDRRPSPVAVLALLALLCLPVALAPSWPLLLVLIIPTGLFCAPVMSVTAEALTGATPASQRGLVLGLHSSALTLGNAAGAPLVGWVIDQAAPRLAFVAIAVAGLALALVAAVVARSAPAPVGASRQDELARV